jgi:hypothetical protein
MLSDLRKAVHNQAWGRPDVKVLEEAVRNNAPMSVRNNPKALREWLDDRLSDIAEMYDELEPDDAFVHYD